MEFIKIALIFYAITFFTSGALLYVKNDFARAVFCVLPITIFAYEIIRNIKRKYMLDGYIGILEVNLEKEKISIKALIDTGNDLKTEDKEEVIIVSQKVIAKIKNQNVKDILIKNKMVVTEDMKNKIKVIRYCSLGNEFDFKFGIKVKGIEFFHNNKKYVSDGIIICSENNFEDYDALVSLSFINSKEEENAHGDFVFNKRKSKEVIY